ncbi:MAG: hypothetical protein QOJ92_540 [Frankiales bacterium]|nr:hypothetical protein [Frankiales bacterium]
MSATGGACPGCGGPVEPSDEICPSCDVPLRPPERRLVTLLFADLTGYTRLCQDLDPEDVHTTIAPLMARLRRIAESLGALVEAVQGDGFLAAWGARQAHSDDVDRAVSAAVRMQQTVEAWRSSHPAFEMRLPGLHASVHLDEVLVAPARSSIGLSVTGDGVNVASRLCGLAAEGQVLLSREALAATGTRLPLEALEAHVVRGRDRPVEAAALRWVEYDDQRPPQRPRVDVPLVDRTQLRAALTLLTQTGGAAVLVGEPGVGKTRVIREVVDGLDGWVVLRGAVPAFGSLGWSDALGAALRSVGSEPVALPQLLGLAAGWSPSPLIERRLLHLLGITSGSEESDDETARASAFTAWWVAVAAAHPVALIVDDLHHAGPELSDFLRRLADRPTAHPAIVLATARDEALGAGAGWAALPTWPVPPLAAAEASTLIERLLPGARPELAQGLAERSGGNPLFAEEVAALLLERDAVQLSDAGAVLTSPEAISDIPSGLRLLVMARLDLLTPAAQQVVRGAAVLGVRFSQRTLEVLLALFDVPAALAELALRGMVEQSPSDADVWVFRHALLRDVAYGALARTQRGRLHVAAAALAAAEQASAGDPGGAHHLFLGWECSRTAAAPGGDLGLAWRCAEELLEVCEFLAPRRPSACRRLLELGTQIAEQMPASEAGRLRIRLGVLQLEASLAEGAEVAALAAAEELLAADLTDHERGEVLFLRGKARWALDDLPAARSDLDAAVVLLDSAGQRARAAQARAVRAFTAEGDLEAMTGEHRAGWPAAVASGNKRIQIDLATNLATDLSVVAGSEAAQWREVAAGLLGPADHVGRAWLELALAYSAAYRLDWAAARGAALRARVVGLDANNLQLHGNAHMVVVEACLNLNLLDEARSELGSLTTLLEQRTSPRGHQFLDLMAAAVAARSGDAAPTRELLEQARLRAQSVPLGDRAFFHIYSAQSRLQLGEWDGALEDASQGLQLSLDHGHTAAAVSPLLTLLSLTLGTSIADGHARALWELAPAHDAPIARASVQRWVQEHRLLGGSPVSEEPLLPATTPEQRALDAELDALRTRTTESLAAAAALWEQAGQRIWASRARTWLAAASGTAPPAEVPPPLLELWQAQWQTRSG